MGARQILPGIDTETYSQKCRCQGAVSLNWPDDRQTEGQKVQALAFIEIIPVGSLASWEPHCLAQPFLLGTSG